MKYRPGTQRVLRLQSPPSRGAWIEIHPWVHPKLSVVQSPPSRGAWIEIALFRA